jgi:DNA-directed RNA polymerase specialized sigma24 family protein
MDDAFREIYERYYRDVYRFSLFLSGHSSKVDDLTAETFPSASDWRRCFPH